MIFEKLNKLCLFGRSELYVCLEKSSPCSLGHFFELSCTPTNLVYGEMRIIDVTVTDLDLLPIFE